MGSSCTTQGDQLRVCDHIEWWDKEGGMEKQEGGDIGIYVYV